MDSLKMQPSRVRRAADFPSPFTFTLSFPPNRSTIEPKRTAGMGEKRMSRQFPVLLDISSKKIYVYGAGRIASRRVKTLLDLSP